jgi:hypothetical protein
MDIGVETVSARTPVRSAPNNNHVANMDVERMAAVIEREITARHKFLRARGNTQEVSNEG